MVILSFAGALACGLMPAARARQIRWMALVTAALGLITALHCCLRYSGEGMADELDLNWIPSLGAHFAVGYDGISLPLLLVTGLVAVCGVLFTWDLKERANEFYAYYFALIGGVYGVFLSLDLFLLFVFYEIAVVPKYFLIATWGGTRKDYAAMKLVLYSFAGSALVLLGLLALYFGAHATSFTFAELEKANLSASLQCVAFPLLFVGFGVLAGMWPFHTWAPTGHVAAPTAASMLLAGVVMKLGAYGCLRVAIGLLPLGAKAWAPCVAALAVVNIVYGALVALRQTDFKFVIGYSSVSHMGFVLLGLATLNQTGLTGAVLQMFSHGVIGALLFALVGSVIYSRTHTRQLEEFHLLMARMPVIAWVFIVAGMASMGLPGFSGFAAELHVLIGAWQSPWVSPLIVALAGAGIVATFAYTLVKIHEAFFRGRSSAAHTNGELSAPYAPMTVPEIIGCALLLGSALVVGLFPSLLTDKMQASLKLIVDRLQAAN
ncbi:MAG: NADH-quinone oxidoreductase subunit M [Pedosphaera sp.]|nr:NADH-quinone oxidoreductase subunit M [Pedosphaera sp.]MSU44085.1 NADH-quinone oxidoreductase subunit M [Pedosphaera sp.]